jgi:Dolichyl-phosphate-mannose-protein mannosyltransferase
MTAELAGCLGSVGLFAVPGACLTELFPSLRRLPAARRAAYGYLLGVAVVAGTLYFLSHAFGVPLRPPAVWAVAAATAATGLAAGLVRRAAGRGRLARSAASGPAAAARTTRLPGTAGRRLAEWQRRLGGRLPAFCALAATLVSVGLLAEAASNPVHDWDGRMTWGAQARYVRAEGTVDAAVLRNVRWFISHPQYPLLLPVAQVAALEALGGGPDSHFQRAVYAAFFPALLLLVYDGARRSAGRTAAALAVLAAAAVPFFAYGEGGAFSTYSDLPLACFYGAAVLLLLGPRPLPVDGLAAGLLLGAAALSKNEGALLALLALPLGWRSGRMRRGKVRARREALLRLAAAAVPVALALALFVSWRAGIPNRQDENYPDMVQAGRLWPGIVTHVAVFGPVLLRQMSRFHHWAGFWWMAPAILLAGRRTLRRPLNRRRLLAAACPPAIAWAAYSLHGNPGFLSSVTWERFLLQAAVPTLILLACALAEVRRRLARPWRPAAPVPPPPAPGAPAGGQAS